MNTTEWSRPQNWPDSWSIITGDGQNWIGNKVNEKNQSGTMICSDETEDSLVSLFKMISENDMRTFMDEQGKSLLSCMF